jgi:hypothetical protein
MYAVRVPSGRVLVERETLRDAKIAAIYEALQGPVEIIGPDGTVQAVVKQERT